MFFFCVFFFDFFFFLNCLKNTNINQNLEKSFNNKKILLNKTELSAALGAQSFSYINQKIAKLIFFSLMFLPYEPVTNKVGRVRIK